MGSERKSPERMGFYEKSVATHGVRSEIPERRGSETFRTNRLQTCFMYVREVRSDSSKPSPRRLIMDPRHALPVHRSAPRAARLKKASMRVREGGARESQQPNVRHGAQVVGGFASCRQTRYLRR
jgi:hypothetical protein